MKQQKKAFSLIIAMMIVLVSSLLAYTIIDFILPFSNNIRGVENSVNAYYEANSGVEKALYFFSKREGADIDKDITNGGSITDGIGNSYYTTSSGKNLPIAGEGNGIDKDYNIISMGEPIQLSVGNGFITNLNDLKIYFKTPNLTETVGIPGDNLDNNINGYIAWQLSSENGTIYSYKDTLITSSQINGSEITIADLKGIMYNGGNEFKGIQIHEVFNGSGSHPSLLVDKLNCGSIKCILSFSIINELKTDNGKTLPFLEWQIDAGPSNTLPLRYSQIYSTGQFFGFGRTLEVGYPQDTLNQAFDFTVIQ